MVRQDPQDLRRRLSQLAAERGGYFSAREALQTGYSYPAQAYHVERGDWLRLERGIYRLADWPIPPGADLIHWTLWSRDQAVVSHESALAVHQLGDVVPVQVHLTVPPTFRARTELAVLHRGSLPASDIEARPGYRVTTPERSIADVAAFMEIGRLTAVVEDAVRRGLVSVKALSLRSAQSEPRSALGIERAMRLARTK